MSGAAARQSTNATQSDRNAFGTRLTGEDLSIANSSVGNRRCLLRLGSISLRQAEARLYIGTVVAGMEAEETSLTFTALIRPQEEKRVHEALFKSLALGPVHDATGTMRTLFHALGEQEFDGHIRVQLLCSTLI